MLLVYSFRRSSRHSSRFLTFRFSASPAVVALLLLFKLQLLLGAATVHAFEIKNRLSGFASIGIGQVSEPDITVIDYDDNLSGRSDTMLALQLNTLWSANLSTTAQLITKAVESDGNSEFEPDFEWLFASYQHSATTRVRAGRMRIPIFLYSDTLSVGYAHTWSRPPIDLYKEVLRNVSTFEGVDLNTVRQWWGQEIEMTLFAGYSRGEHRGRELTMFPLMGTVFLLHRDDLLIRYGLSVAIAEQNDLIFEGVRGNLDRLMPSDPIFRDIYGSSGFPVVLVK